MININISSHKKTLEKFSELEKTMQDERKSQLQLIEDLKTMWSGPARAALEKSYPYMLQEGLYGQTLEQVSGMRKVMEDALPAIRRQKSKCDTFVNCLRCGVPLANGAPDGNLMLEENAVSSIITMCDEVKSSSDSIESELNVIMDMCSGIVDFGSEREALYAACRKADRIIDLKEAIHSYCRDVLDLDEALRAEYAAWKDEEIYSEIVRKEAELDSQKCVQEMEDRSEKPETEWEEVEEEKANISDKIEKGIDDFMDSSAGTVVSAAVTACSPHLMMNAISNTIVDMSVKQKTLEESLTDRMNYSRGFTGSIPKVAVETAFGIAELPGAAVEIGKQIHENGFRNTVGSMAEASYINITNAVEDYINNSDPRSKGEADGRVVIAAVELIAGSKGVTQGIKGAGAAKKAVSAADKIDSIVDVIELAEKAEKTSKSAKILEKIGDIKNIADVAEDFAQDTQNVERYVNEIESGLDTGIQRELDDLLNSDYYKYDLGYDCSEIAEDFYNAAGNQGNIYRIEGKNGIINGYEYNDILEFDYCCEHL